MVDHDDEALARLRASDPATGTQPDLHRLRRLVAAKAPASSVDHQDAAVRIDDPVGRGTGLRAPWLAAAAVALLATGAGGYAAGLQQGTASHGTLTPGGAPDAAAASGSAAPDQASGSVGPQGSDGASASLTPADTASGSSSGSGSASSSMTGAPQDVAPVTLVAGQGLSTERTTGTVRALRSGADPRAFVRGWARRSGFTGQEVTAGEGSSFGPGTVLVDPDRGVFMQATTDTGSLQFTYQDLFATSYCREMLTGVKGADLERAQEDWQAQFGGLLPFPDASRCRTVPGERPSEAQAQAAARDFLAAAGLDASTYTFTVVDGGSPAGGNELQLEGAPPGGAADGQLAIWVTVNPEGVVGVNGSVGEMASLGRYPVISPVEAVQRYAERLWTTDYVVSIPDPGGSGTQAGSPAPPQQLPPPSTGKPGMRVPLLLRTKTVVSATLVQGSLQTANGGAMEVPVWRLKTADGAVYPVLALADEAIDWQSWG